MMANIMSLMLLWMGGVVMWRCASRQLAVAYIYWLVGLMCMATSTAISWFRTPLYFPSLPDIGHDMLPMVITVWGMDAHRMCDSLMYLTATTTLVFALCTPGWRIILRRFFVIYGTLMFLRSITLLATSLPDPYPLCEEYVPGTYDWGDMPWSEVLVEFMGMFGPNEHASLTCGDLIFSGHTILFVLCAMTWHTYYTPMHMYMLNPVKLSIWVISIIGTVLLIVTRMHWTIDIMLAYFITVVVWNAYHSVCRDLFKGWRLKHVIWIDGAIIYPFISWLEIGTSYKQYHSRHQNKKLH